jgi:hypothetical protein
VKHVPQESDLPTQKLLSHTRVFGYSDWTSRKIMGTHVISDANRLTGGLALAVSRVTDTLLLVNFGSVL